MSGSMVQDATIRNLEVIGEAAKQVSPEYRSEYPDVPWSGMAGMRDILIHQYMGVDLDTVWDVVENRLDEIEDRLESILSQDGA